MKFVLVILALVFGAWLWQRNRAQDPASAAKPPPQPAPDTQPVQHMVACAHCGIHLPAADAIQHPSGWYCSHPHLQQHIHPPPGGA